MTNMKTNQCCIAKCRGEAKYQEGKKKFCLAHLLGTLQEVSKDIALPFNQMLNENQLTHGNGNKCSKNPCYLSVN